MRIYVSSTFEDLQEHRAAAIRALHQLGHDVVAMEYYGAGTAPPLAKVLKDVESCDVYVGIFAWRYGFRPDESSPTKVPNTKPGETSITEFEYRKAVQAGLEVLAFLVDERAPWPAHLIDGVSRLDDAPRTLAFRNILQKERVVAYFTTSDSLATQVATAVSTIGLRGEIRRGLLSPLRSEKAVPVLAGQPLYDSHVEELKNFVLESMQAPAVHVDLSRKWWISRLYLLAALGEAYGELRRIVFLNKRELIGVASAAFTRREMLRFYDGDRANRLRKFEGHIAASERVGNLDRELNDLISEWGRIAGHQDELLQPAHAAVTATNLERLLGEGLLTQSLRVSDVGSLTVLDLLRILDFPSDVVPVEETRPRSRRGVVLIDKTALTDTVARNSVQETLDRLGLA